MTVLSQLLTFFPTLVMMSASAAFVGLCLADSWLTVGTRLLILLFILYGIPVLTYRVHHAFYKIPEGISYLKGESYSPWWGSHQIQAIYIAFPALETALRLLPGLFSKWLRLWGAQIGQQVYWGSIGEIADRGLLKIGDRAIIGHRVGFYAHIIKPKRDNLLLYVKHIEIGENAFIGSGSYIGAGVAVAPNGYLEAGSEIHPNQFVTLHRKAADRVTIEQVTIEQATIETPIESAAEPAENECES